MVAIACFLLYDALDIVLSDRKEAGRRWVVSLAAIALMGGRIVPLECIFSCEKGNSILPEII